MKKVHISTLLFCVGLFAAVFAESSNARSGMHSARAARPAPTPKKLGSDFLKKKYDESAKICNGNQIKPELTNPSCEGWHEGSITDAEWPFYQSNYPDACAYGVDGLFRCFFKTGKAGCTAFSKARDADPLLASDAKKVCGCGKLAQGSTDTYKCAYCWKMEEGCTGTGTQFFNSLKCENGLHDIELRTILPGEYHAYCGIAVSGPYSSMAENGTESYSACGAEHTETYPGMIFVRDQRDRMRAVNRANNRGKIKSDLAGFCYDPPKGNVANCIETHPNIPGKCREPEFLPGSNFLYEKDSPQVHHVVPAKDRRGCPCGKNSVKNAAIISSQLNQYFTNKNRTGFKFNCTSGQTEIQVVNGRPKWDPSLVAKAAPVSKPTKKMIRNKSRSLRKP